MKITDIATSHVSVGVCAWTMVTVATDDGLQGIGEASLAGREREVAAAVESLRPRLLGRDPFDVEALSGPGDGPARAALSGLTGAMLDCAAQRLGVPICQMFGGAVRERARLCAIGWGAQAASPDEWAHRAAAAVAAGFTALKLRPLAASPGPLSQPETRRAVAIVEAARQAAGENVDLIVDLEGRLAPSAAVTLAHSLAPYQPVWLEEPVAAGALEALAKVASLAGLPLAAGASLSERDSFQRLIEGQAIDVAAVDLCRLGGIGEGRKVAASAEVYHVNVALSGANGPVALAMALQVAACIPNLAWVEYPAQPPAAWGEVLAAPFEVADGHVGIPVGPGLGIEIRQPAR